MICAFVRYVCRTQGYGNCFFLRRYPAALPSHFCFQSFLSISTSFLCPPLSWSFFACLFHNVSHMIMYLFIFAYPREKSCVYYFISTESVRTAAEARARRVQELEGEVRQQDRWERPLLLWGGAWGAGGVQLNNNTCNNLSQHFCSHCSVLAVELLGEHFSTLKLTTIRAHPANIDLKNRCSRSTSIVVFWCSEGLIVGDTNQLLVLFNYFFNFLLH